MLTQILPSNRVLSLLSILVCGFFFSGCKPPTDPVVIVPPPEYPECQPHECKASGQNHKVMITATGSKPGIIEACPGDTITWIGQEQGISGSPFLLYFKENGTRPCINCAVRSKATGKGDKKEARSVIIEQVLTHKIAPNAPAGCYDYEVALMGKRKVFDPRVIIGQ